MGLLQLLTVTNVILLVLVTCVLVTCLFYIERVVVNKVIV